MTKEYIWIKNKKYFHHKTFTRWNEAIKVAKRQKRKYKRQYFILKTSTGIPMGIEQYGVFLNKKK